MAARAVTSGRKTAYIAITASAVVVTVVSLLLRHQPSEADIYPDSADARETWVCNACGKDSDLTPREVFEAVRRAGVSQSRDRGDGGTMTSVRETKIACPACGALGLARAQRCSACDAAFVPGGRSSVFCTVCAGKQDTSEPTRVKPKARRNSK